MPGRAEEFMEAFMRHVLAVLQNIQVSTACSSCETCPIPAETLEKLREQCCNQQLTEMLHKFLVPPPKQDSNQTEQTPGFSQDSTGTPQDFCRKRTRAESKSPELRPQATKVRHNPADVDSESDSASDMEDPCPDSPDFDTESTPGTTPLRSILDPELPKIRIIRDTPVRTTDPEHGASEHVAKGDHNLTHSLDSQPTPSLDQHPISDPQAPDSIQPGQGSPADYRKAHYCNAPIVTPTPGKGRNKRVHSPSSPGDLDYKTPRTTCTPPRASPDSDMAQILNFGTPTPAPTPQLPMPTPSPPMPSPPTPRPPLLTSQNQQKTATTQNKGRKHRLPAYFIPKNFPADLFVADLEANEADLTGAIYVKPIRNGHKILVPRTTQAAECLKGTVRYGHGLTELTQVNQDKSTKYFKYRIQGIPTNVRVSHFTRQSIVAQAKVDRDTAWEGPYSLILYTTSPIKQNQLLIQGHSWAAKPLQETPIRCTRCQSFGHSRHRCNARQPTCAFCAGHHPSNDCYVKRQNHQQVTLKCANCEGAHATTSQHCPVFKNRAAESRPTQHTYLRKTNGAWATAKPPSQVPPPMPSQQRRPLLDFPPLLKRVETIQKIHHIKHLIAELKEIDPAAVALLY